MDRADTIEFAKKYLEDMVAFFGLNLDVEVSVEDDIIVAVIPSNEQNSLLIGRGAENLRSLQYLLSTTLRNLDAEVSRVNVDIAGYKKQHAEKLVEKATGVFVKFDDMDIGTLTKVKVELAKKIAGK